MFFNKTILKTPSIIKAFDKINRVDFLPQEVKKLSNIDSPLPIGFGQTSSQPTTVAFMLEQLRADEGDRVLDVGCGSGWTTALLAHIVGFEGEVIGVEIIPELVAFGIDNIAKYNFSNANIYPIQKTLGYRDKAPFDKILVSAAAVEIPQELVDQLKVGGRLVIPVRNSIFVLNKISQVQTRQKEFPGFSFVPLIS